MSKIWFLFVAFTFGIGFIGHASVQTFSAMTIVSIEAENDLVLGHQSRALRARRLVEEQ